MRLLKSAVALLLASAFVGLLICGSAPSYSVFEAETVGVVPDLLDLRSNLIYNKTSKELILWTMSQDRFEVRSIKTVYYNETIPREPVRVLTRETIPPSVIMVSYNIEDLEMKFLWTEYSITTSGNHRIHIEKTISSIPGNLLISKAAVAHPSSLMITRKLESRIFRMYSHDQTINGPLQIDFPGRPLAFCTLYSDGPDPIVLVVQYEPYTNSLQFKVTLSIFMFENEIWSRDVLWDVELAGLGDDRIDPDKVHFMYFLTDPHIGVRNDSKLASFVFLERIFTIEYDANAVNSTKHGYILTTCTIPQLSGSQLDTIMITFVSDGDQDALALVTEVTSVYIRIQMYLCLPDQLNKPIIHFLPRLIGFWAQMKVL
jgi:hypothetical protein